MSRFLVLSKRIINTRHILDILVEKNMYTITLASRQNFSGYMFMDLGYVSTDRLDKLYIEKEEEEEENEFGNSDYDKVSDFIKSIGYDMKDNDNHTS